jgi:hypothetical protein
MDGMDPSLDDGQFRVSFDRRLVEQKQPAFQALSLLPVDEGVVGRPTPGSRTRSALGWLTLGSR